MNLLLVEDDENKRQQLLSFLKEHLQDANFTVERSLQSGLRRIRSDKFDVVILDMTLPTYDPTPDESGGQAQIFGGREFLRQMDRFEIDTPVIVVTQFETFGKGIRTMSLQDLDRELRDEHATRYRGAVYYHAAIQGWQPALKALLNDSWLSK